MSWEYDSWFNEWTHGRMPVLRLMEKAEKFDRGKAFRDRKGR
jgi:hypothetical protein